MADSNDTEPSAGLGTAWCPPLGANMAIDPNAETAEQDAR
jgi:hypothetical protein